MIELLEGPLDYISRNHVRLVDGTSVRCFGLKGTSGTLAKPFDTTNIELVYSSQLNQLTDREKAELSTLN